MDRRTLDDEAGETSPAVKRRRLSDYRIRRFRLNYRCQKTMLRPGDYIDDYCSRCKRGMDHAVVSVKGEEADRVRCRTCDYEHPYRKNRGGKKEMTNKDAFDQVLASVMGSLPSSTPVKKPKRK
ncbi:MAG TPA: hypothetical protein VE998_01400 [Terriglobales bacterium]|nr:hypothetical protein [Terriglobales bacterium]